MLLNNIVDKTLLQILDKINQLTLNNNQENKFHRIYKKIKMYK